MKMTTLHFENMLIDIFADELYSSRSTDNKYKYNQHHRLMKINDDECYATKYAVIIKDKEENIIDSVIIIADGAGMMTPHDENVVIDDELLVIAIGRYIVALELPSLRMKWNVTTENCYVCFSVHKIGNRYISHCEGSVIGIDKVGSLEWEFTGRDIFVSENGENEFVIKEKFIELRDWENNKYHLLFDGTQIEL